MQKILKIPYRYLETIKKMKLFRSVMTSMTMFTQSRIPSNFVRIWPLSKLDGFIRILAWNFD